MSFTFHRPKADESAGFPEAPAKRLPDTATPPRQRGPNKCTTAFQPVACQMIITPPTSKTMGTAGSRFKTI